MKAFLKLRVITFFTTIGITWLFTRRFGLSSALSLTLIGVNTIVMYLVLKKEEL